MRTVLCLAMLAAVALPATAGAAPTSSEKAAAKRISTHIQQSGEMRNYRIGVTFKNGIATLNGSVASSEQRDTAIRLAEQIEGVGKVNCQLLCPEAPKATASKAEKITPKGTDAAIEQASRFEESAKKQAIQASAQQEIRPAMRPAMRPQQRQLQQQRQSRPMMARQPMRRPAMPRNNMPLPQRRMMDPSFHQASAQQGVHQAGCNSCGPNGGGMGGPGMGGGGMGGPGMMGGGAGMMAGGAAGVMPAGFVPHGGARGPSYENAQMPGYAWPSYAAYPNYAALSYPQQYSPTAWPYIGPFYPYPQVPLAWRKVSLEWDDGWWFLDFSAHNSSH
jgi:BON domain